MDYGNIKNSLGCTVKHRARYFFTLASALGAFFVIGCNEETKPAQDKVQSEYERSESNSATNLRLLLFDDNINNIPLESTPSSG